MAKESKAQLIIYNILNPLIVLMHKIGVTPNMITSIGFILNIVAAVIFIIGGEQADRTDMFYVGWGGFTILIAGLFDMMDGRLARIANLSSSFGFSNGSLQCISNVFRNLLLPYITRLFFKLTFRICCINWIYYGELH